ncbi:SpoIIIAC/SpoIIIAD family protein [Alkalibacterium putridalgicola]|nr:SpoIIIAC/SpoIIIAD family protein [Alkalibacterium putridalgicola]
MANRKEKGSTGTMTRIVIGILVLTMVVPVFASLLSVL